MTILDQVRALITRLSPNTICDDCVTEKLGLPARQHVNYETRELSGENRFQRSKAICSLCNQEKLVTQFS